ncbi:MAG: hypothetical protein ABSD59_26615 [Terracidiphilus sp.]|jgi:hypothetical protein
MRSKLIFVALGREQNRYLLSQLIAKATRKLHRPHTRVPDTMNDALALFGVAQSGTEAAILEPALVELRKVA